MLDNRQRKKVLIEAARAAAAVAVGAENPKVGRQSAIQVIEHHFKNDIVVAEGMSADRVNLLSPAFINSFSGWVLGFLYESPEGKVLGVSLAYVEGGQSLIGAVYNVERKEFYFAEQGGGAFLNNHPIHVAVARQITHDTLVGSSHSGDDLDNRKNLERILRLNPIPKILFEDSPALAMMAVAGGQLDIYHHMGLKPWDNVASFIIATEAGAKIVDTIGKPASFISSRVVVGNPKIVDDFISQTKQ